MRLATQESRAGDHKKARDVDFRPANNTSDSFFETLIAWGVTHVLGIVGDEHKLCDLSTAVNYNPDVKPFILNNDSFVQVRAEGDW